MPDAADDHGHLATRLTYCTRWGLCAGTQRFCAAGRATLVHVAKLTRYFPMTLIFLKGALR